MADPNLSDLDAFAAVAKARSFRGAAMPRNVSASSLSEAVRRLEARLRVRLLNRTTRSVTPTEAGRRLLERIEPALAEIAGALDGVSGDSAPAGTLRLNVPFIVAEKILPPIARRFLAAHPQIALEVVAENTFVDVLAAGFDAGIRYEERLERDMIAVPIGPRIQRFVLAGAPAYLAARGIPAHPRDLVDHACLQFRFASGVRPPWEFERGAETVKINPQGPLVTTSIEHLMESARGGLGLLFLFEDYLQSSLDADTLRPVLSDWWPSFPGPRLYYPSRSHNPPPLQAFLDFLRSERGQNTKTSGDQENGKQPV